MRKDASRLGTRPLIAALLLLLFALSGLGAGFASRTALDGFGSAGQAAAPTSMPTATVAETPTPLATPTAAQLLGPSHFTFKATAAPRTLVPGQAFTISAVLVAADGSTPVANVTCYLRAPDDSAPLFTPWPAPVQSDATGQAIWNLTAPQLAPGIYQIEVYAFGEHGWSFRYNTTVTLQA
jgi:hypothetical protein